MRWTSMVAVLLLASLGASLGSAQEGAPPAAIPPAVEEPAAASPAAAGAPSIAREDEAKQIIEEIKQNEEMLLTGGKDSYNYDPAGRPDPFVNPMKETTGSEDVEARPPGWPGMLINEVQLHGITVFGTEPIAMFLGTDGIGYFAREGDELWDGKIEVIDFEDGLVAFKQKVEDPSSPIRHRRVEKKLNP